MPGAAITVDRAIRHFDSGEDYYDQDARRGCATVRGRRCNPRRIAFGLQATSAIMLAPTSCRIVLQRVLTVGSMSDHGFPPVRRISCPRRRTARRGRQGSLTRCSDPSAFLHARILRNPSQNDDSFVFVFANLDPGNRRLPAAVNRHDTQKDAQRRASEHRIG